MRVGQIDRLLERLQHRLHALLRAGAAFTEDGHELVAAETRQQGHFTQCVLESRGRLRQQLIRQALTQRVVVQLEVVQIQQRHGVGGAVVRRVVAQVGGEVVQGKSVRQTGQRILRGALLALAVVAEALNRDRCEVREVVDQLQILFGWLAAVAVVHAEHAEQVALGVLQRRAPGAHDAVHARELHEGLPQRIHAHIAADHALRAKGGGAATATHGPGLHAVDGILKACWQTAVAALAQGLGVGIEDQQRGHHGGDGFLAEARDGGQRFRERGSAGDQFKHALLALQEVIWGKFGEFGDVAGGARRNAGAAGIHGSCHGRLLRKVWFSD